MQDIVRGLSDLLRPHIVEGCDSIIVEVIAGESWPEIFVKCPTGVGSFIEVLPPHELRQDVVNGCHTLCCYFESLGCPMARVGLETSADGRSQVWAQSSVLGLCHGEASKVQPVNS